MKEGPRSTHGSYWFLVHHGITVSVCAYITGEVFIHSAPESSERSPRALQGVTLTGVLLARNGSWSLWCSARMG
jgi:hypothetical protein